MGVIGVANPLVKGVYRNLPCPCGSGKKSKRCHGKELVITREEYDEIMNFESSRNREFVEALKNAAEKAIESETKDETEISS